MLYIALHYDNRENLELTEIAAEQDIPKHFLSKILQTMVKRKLLISTKGPNGGFKLSKSPEKIKLVEIVDAIDGLDIFTQCGIGFKKCNDKNPCPIHNDYKKIRDKVEFLFENKSLKDLTEDIRNGNSIVSLNNTMTH